jgi:thioredoxin-dependent peroxiredoxin
VTHPVRSLAASCLAALTAAAALTGAAAQAPAPALNVGDVAPGFTLTGSDGRTCSLSDYRGVKPVVLAWFPRAPIKD